MTPDEFRHHGHALIDWIADYLDGGVEHYPVGSPVQPGDIRSMLPEHPPSRANESGRALFTRTVLDGRVACRVSIGGRTTEARHVGQAWALLRDLA